MAGWRFEHTYADLPQLFPYDLDLRHVFLHATVLLDEPPQLETTKDANDDALYGDVLGIDGLEVGVGGLESNAIRLPVETLERGLRGVHQGNDRIAVARLS